MVIVTGDEKNQVLHFNRGDDIFIHFTVKDQDGNEYEMQTGDYLTFTAREFPDPENAETLLEATSFTKDFHLRHDYTDAVEVGIYSADCELHKYDPSGTYDPDDPDKGYQITTIWPHIEASYVKHGKTKNWKNFCCDAEVTCKKHES